MKTSPSQVILLAEEFQKRVSQILGEEIQVILFGSHARGEATEESDINLLVLLPIIDKQKMDKILDISWELGYSAGIVISVIPATQAEMDILSLSPFFQNVKREGIRI